jgi:polyketide biosynthesis 3-hydroxy-3-methylglutaryl-CoA synthase-like enzyme PksG
LIDGGADPVGIDRASFYGGRAFLDVYKLAEARRLNRARFDNLLIRRKSLHFPFEDPVSFAVNAAKPLVDSLHANERRSIELLIVASESGIDLGKSISTYVHKYLDLDRRCRLFEVKQACYGGTAALQMAVAAIRTAARPDARALVICTDLGRPVPHSYAEPTQGGAAIALLVGRNPGMLELETGASGFWSYEVMDACRPSPTTETGDADLSLLTYLDCIWHSFEDYQRNVGEVDFQDNFDLLAFHTPFGGMVKGAHRTMMRRLKRLSPNEIEADFTRRVAPSLTYCGEVGNIYSGTVFLALCGALAAGSSEGARPRPRIGLFSYGSGCSSEFYSGIVAMGARVTLERSGIAEGLASRRELCVAGYEKLLAANQQDPFGLRDAVFSPAPFDAFYRSEFEGRGLLVLDRIVGYQRQYRWS